MVKNKILITLICITGICSILMYTIFHFQGNLISIKNDSDIVVNWEILFIGNQSITVKIENLKSGDSYEIPISKYFEWSIWLKIFQEGKKPLEEYISWYYESSLNERFDITISKQNWQIQVQGITQ